MRREIFLAVMAIGLFGCSNESASTSANQPPELSSTIDRPEEKKLAQSASLADLESRFQLKAYPGAQTHAAEVLGRGDGGTKFVVQFTTKDNPAKVTEFYKKELGDGKTDEKGIGTSMGMTKANGSVIVIAEPAENGSKVKVTLISYNKS